MAISYVVGDATEPQGEGTKFVAHVANNIGAWGKGFVLAVSRRWSMPELMYRKWAMERPEELRLGLGKIQVIPVEREVVVVNIIGQDGIRSKENPTPVSYDAIRTGLQKIQDIMLEAKNPSLHIPRIGCGLAGGSWAIVEQIIEETITFPVCVYDPPGQQNKFNP